MKFNYIVVLIGGIAAAVTTPLDVVKTQIMLADCTTEPKINPGILPVIKNIYRKHGITK